MKIAKKIKLVFTKVNFKLLWVALTFRNMTKVQYAVKNVFPCYT